MNNLNDFGIGWQNKFNSRIETLKRVFPSVEIQSFRRFYGMLDVVATIDDEDVKYAFNATCIAIRRESSKVCEQCGKFGKVRGKEHDVYVLPEQKCMCTLCFTLEVDRIESTKN